MLTADTVKTICEEPSQTSYNVFYYDPPALNAAIRALRGQGKQISAAAHLHTWAEALNWWRRENPDESRNDYYQELVMMGVKVRLDDEVPINGIRLYLDK